MRVALLVLTTLTCSVGSWTSGAHAQAPRDRVLLQEVVPALEGTEIGRIPVGDAPLPGRSLIVRRSDVHRALALAGRSADGLVVPARSRIERRARTVEVEELSRLARRALSRAIDPCTVGDVRVPHAIEVGAGPIEAHVDARAPSAGSSVSGYLVVEAGGTERRIPVRASIECPEPVIAPGSQVRIIAHVGGVRASAQGEARQAGRPGDVIRVRNDATQRVVEARVIDSGTVEVVR